MSTQGPFNQLLKLSRASIECDGNVCRIVFHSQVIPIKDGLDLAKYVADRAPLFYREPQKISEQLADGYFLSTVKAALGRLPTADSFQNSHFAEIASGIFAEEVMDLSLLYSKLSLLTAENANAFKMDLVLFDPKPDPIEFVFGEVKSSTKSSAPARHDRGCYADLFNTFSEYGERDLEFDLAAARDRIAQLPTELQARLRAALLPYSGTKIRYAGFVVVDSATYSQSEVKMLSTRQHSKTFDVDLICVESLGSVSQQTYQILERVRTACSQ